MTKAQWACNIAPNWRYHLQSKRSRWHRPHDDQIVISKWENHVPTKRRHRPRDGQIVILHQSEEITYLLRGDTGRGMVRLWFCIRVRRSRTSWETTQTAGWSDCDFASEWGDHVPPERRHGPRDGQIMILHPGEITYPLRDDTGRRMVRLWFASEWGDHVPPERRHRPRDGQIVILHPSEEITYPLRDDTDRGMVRLWFASEWGDHVQTERRHRDGQTVILHPSEETTYLLRDDTGRGMVRLYFVSKWGDHLPTNILTRYITTSGIMTFTVWWNHIHPQYDNFGLIFQSWSLCVNFDNMYLLAVEICDMVVSTWLWNALWTLTCCTGIH